MSPAYGFSKQNRIQHQREFDAVFSSAKRIKLLGVLLLYAPNNFAAARLGLLVPKRLLKLAVSRNRFKRLVREEFRYQKAALGGHDVIVLLQSRSLADEPLAWRGAIHQVFAELLSRMD